MKEYLPYLRHFYEVVRAGGFSAASRSMRISQPSISKTIRLLEERVGRRLLNRTRNGVVLTEDGSVFYEKCERIFLEVESLNEVMNAATQEIEGTLELACSDNIAIHVIPEFAVRFLKTYPQVRFQLFSGTSQDIKEEIKKMRSEIGVFYTKPEVQEGFEVEQIGLVEFVVVIAKKNRWFDGSKRIVLKDLQKKEIPNIGSRTIDYYRDPPALTKVRSLHLPDKMLIECNQHEVKKKLVEQGLGYAVLTHHSVIKEIQSEKLKVIDVGQKLFSPLYLVKLKNRPLSKIATRFKKEIILELK